jgi:hypothetical protein
VQLIYSLLGGDQSIGRICCLLCAIKQRSESYYASTKPQIVEPGQRSRYSDYLRAGRLRDRSSSPSTVKNFLFSASSRPALGSTKSPIQWVPGTLSWGVQRPGRETHHSPPASAEVKKIWIYTSTPHMPSWSSA